MTVIGRHDERARQPFGRPPGAARSPADPAAGAPPAPGAIELQPRPGGVCLRPRGELDEIVARRLEREAIRLIDDGEEAIVVDLRAVDDLTPSTPSLLWAIQRYGRARGSKLSVVVGDSPAARAMDRAGLLAGLGDPHSSEQPFFDWTR